MSDTKFVTILALFAFVVWKLHNINVNIYVKEGVELDEDIWG